MTTYAGSVRLPLLLVTCFSAVPSGCWGHSTPYITLRFPKLLQHFQTIILYAYYYSFSSILILLASCQQTCMAYTIAVCVKNS